MLSCLLINLTLLKLSDYFHVIKMYVNTLFILSLVNILSMNACGLRDTVVRNSQN